MSLRAERIIIAIDAMGGDVGLDTTLNATASALNRHANLHCMLVGNQAKIQAHQSYGLLPVERIEIVASTQVVEMGDSPQSVLRHKTDSSMWRAIELVRDGKAQACVSAGNTGALMASARYILKMLPTISRPAICTAVPCVGGHTHWLDLGANVDAKAEQLEQFAIMGSEIARAVDGVDKPRVGLLNVGTEAIKGSQVIKEAAKRLEESALNYVGFVEGDDIFLNPQLEVVVCDGFVGNVALKSSEGLAKYIQYQLSQSFRKNIFTKLAGLMALPVLRQMKASIDPRRYNGASLVGLQGIIVKSHGNADAYAFENAINIAHLEIQHNVLERIREKLSSLSLSSDTDS